MTNAHLETALEAVLADVAASSRLSHVVMSVASDDGSIEWAGAAGVADRDGSPMTVDTPFHIASIDKLFTATSILRLVERDEVSLDARLVEYLPPEFLTGIHRLADRDRTGEIRIANLLGHTSGLPDTLEDAPLGGRSMMEEFFDGGDRLMSLEEQVALARRLKAHFPPQPLEARRQKVRYSDTNFQLLIAIIQVITGRPVHEVFHEWIFEPLGMRHTWMFGRSAPAEKTPPPADLFVGDKALDLPLAIESLNSVYSTVGDMTTFIRALVAGEAFEDPATFSVMESRYNRFGLPSDKATLRSPSWPIEYGQGLMRFQLPKLFTGGKRLPAVIGHTGSTGTWTFYCPELGVSLVGAVDEAASGAVPYQVVPKVLRLLSEKG